MNNGMKMKMEVYMKSLNDRIGYKTLKSQFYNELDKSDKDGVVDDGNNQVASVVEISTEKRMKSS